MTYIDAMLAAVPEANKESYITHAREVSPIFIEYGALKVVDAWGETVPEGEVTSMPQAVKKAADEVVVFSYIIWPSKEVRDEGMGKAMQDPRMSPDNCPMPFDGKRLIFGGFDVINELTG